MSETELGYNAYLAWTPSLWMLLVLLLVPAASLAQEGTAILSGRVLDLTSGAPIGFASVVVEHAASGERLTGTLTGEDGRFLVQGLAPDAYTIFSSFPGFHPVETDVLVGELNQSYDVGDIRLVRLESFAEEITVTAEAIRAAGLDTEVYQLDDWPCPDDWIAPRRDEESSRRDGRSGRQGVAARQRPGRHSHRRPAIEPDRLWHAAGPRQRVGRQYRSDRDHQQSLGTLRRRRHGRHHQHHLQAGARARPVGRCRPVDRERPVLQTARRSPDRPRELYEQPEDHSQRQSELQHRASAQLCPGRAPLSGRPAEQRVHDALL